MIFSVIGHSLCSAELYREGVESTIDISSNTRLRKEELIKLSKSFRNSTVTVYWVPSVANLVDALTKISKNPVKVVNGQKYRHGTEPGLEISGLVELSIFHWEIPLKQIIITSLAFIRKG